MFRPDGGLECATRWRRTYMTLFARLRSRLPWRPAFASTRIFVEPCGIGNQVLRYMFAMHLSERMPGSTITGYRMAPFNLESPDDDREGLLRIGRVHRVNVKKVIASARGRKGILVDCYAARLEYFGTLRREIGRRLVSNVAGLETASDEIVINVRSGEILRGIHRDYTPLPINFYSYIVKQTGLRPVFVGQIGPDFYGNALHDRFPDARFFRGEHWIEDFQTVRNAHNIVVAVSTFSWLAAWMSTTARRIHLPVCGLLNPQQRPDIDLVPKEDDRYILHEFPVARYAASDEQIAALVSTCDYAPLGASRAV